MTYEPIDISSKFALFNEQWSPRVIADMNDYQFKIARLEGEFVWHAHSDTDEAFLVIEGRLGIEFRDGTVYLEAGQMFVVPKGVEHKPFATNECKALIIEPRGVVNTGDAGGELTARNDVYI